MTHYYFVENEIKGFDWEVNLSLNPAYTPLTEEQRVFYLDHQDATVWEVRACQMFEPEEPTLEEKKAEGKQQLSQLSLETMENNVKGYQVTNAQTSLYLLSQDAGAETIYDEAKAKEVMEKYSAVGKELREKYKEAEVEIDACESNGEVDALVGYYEEWYLSYEYSEE